MVQPSLQAWISKSRLKGSPSPKRGALTKSASERKVGPGGGTADLPAHSRSSASLGSTTPITPTKTNPSRRQKRRSGSSNGSGLGSGKRRTADAMAAEFIASTPLEDTKSAGRRSAPSSPQRVTDSPATPPKRSAGPTTPIAGASASARPQLEERVPSAVVRTLLGKEVVSTTLPSRRGPQDMSELRAKHTSGRAAGGRAISLATVVCDFLPEPDQQSCMAVRKGNPFSCSPVLEV